MYDDDYDCFAIIELRKLISLINFLIYIYIYIYTVWIWKVSGQGLKQVISIKKKQNFIVYLQLLPPLQESNALSFPSLPQFYIQLEGFFWDVPQIHLWGSLNDFNAFKTGRLDDPLALGKSKKSHGLRAGR